ncbi:TolC family protein [Myxococcota bacterium]|nr:TolC family protein [Myxococcota bacterium]
MRSAESIGTKSSMRAACSLAVLFLTAHSGITFAESAEASAEDGTLYVSQFPTATTGDLAPGAQIVAEGQALSISEALALAIRNNLDVEVERYAPLIAQTDREGAWGAYDPTISADAQYDIQKSPNTFRFINPAASNRDRVKGGGVGIDQMIPYLGASLGLRFDSSASTTRNPFQAPNERFDSSFFVEAKVPLARNLIWNKEWTNVKVATVLSESAREGFREAVMNVVRQTVDAYWSLVASRDQVRVAQKSTETARALLEQTKTQYEVGVVSRVEVVEAEAGVADREFGLIQAANKYRNAQDALISAVLGTQLQALSEQQISPTEDPEDFESRVVDVKAAVAQAFRQRPELARVDLEIDQGELSLKFAKNQRLPQFDVEARFGYVGVSGDGSPDFPTNYDDSTDQFFQGQGNENVRVKGVFSIPFPNTTARKTATKRDLELRRSRTQRTRLEQRIIVEVRAAARLLNASAQGIEASERRRLAAEEQLRAERIRLEHGESTPFEVLQRESDLVEAESQKINALQSYHAADVGLERAQGTILDRHSVKLNAIAEPSR